MVHLKQIALCIAAFLAIVLLLPTLPVLAQTGSISGVVSDAEEAVTLPGATIVIEGANIGTTTDREGNYEITGLDPGDYTVRATFVGYAAQAQDVTVVADETVTANFELVSAALEMEEVVAIGYGARARRDITGSVSSVSAQDIVETPISDAAQAIQGRVSGATALSTGNRPGQSVTIRVRGRRSLTASNEPLFVVDGIPVEGNIDDINPRDIESMEVLKDASATAIYGSRGANGVVLVTTRRGGDHPTMVSYSGHAGISQVHGTPDMMNAEQFAQLKEVAGFEFTSAERAALERGVNTNWIDFLVDDGYQQNHQLSIQGGDANTQFAISANRFDEGGVISHQTFARNTLRLNLDHNVSDRFRVGTSTQLSDRVQHWGSNPYGTALATNPLAEPFDENGELVHRPGADPLIFNPLADLVDNAYVDERSRTRIFGNVYASLDIFENLNYRMNFGPDFQDYRRGLFQGSNTTARGGGTPQSLKEHVRSFTYTFENILTYTHDFANIHSLDLTGLFSLQESSTEWSNVQASGLPYEHQLFHNIGTGTTIENLGSNLEEWGLMSFMARANYQLMDRYLFTVTGRLDGSSRLSDDNRWGFFPAVAFGWHVVDEPFMANQTLFSELRLRASYGVAGNTAIDPYQTRGGLARTAYSFADGSAFGFRPSALANPDLRWETSATANIGVDMGLFDGRIALSAEVYQTHTTDLLLERFIPITSGFNSVLENIGETRNRGFEANITTRNIDRNFVWVTDLNLSVNREEILDLYGTGEDDVGNQWFIGEPLTVWFDYDKIGVWQLDEADEANELGFEPGQIKVRDVNGDGIINEQDRVIIGSDMPTMSIGMGNRFRYAGLDLSIFLFGSFGHTVYNQFAVNNNTLQGRYNNLNVDYWTPDNPTNEHPAPDGTFENPLFNASRGYVRGDFLKVRNIQLGYSMPSSVLDGLGIQRLRVYVNADTPFVFSHLEGGLDPESYGGVIGAGAGPTYRLFTVGVDINF